MRYLIIFALILCTSCKEKLVAPNFNIGHIDSTNVALTTDHDTASANGIAAIRVQLKADAAVQAKYKTVTFTISSYGKFNNGDTIMNAPIDLNGYATAFVNSLEQGITYVKATIGEYSVQKAIVFGKFALADSLSVTVKTDNIPADNYTYAYIQVTTNDPSLIRDSKDITFKTDKGTFANGSTTYTTNAGLDGTTDAYLKHNIAERAIVTATISGTYTRQTTVNFVQAWPNELSVEPAQSTMARTPGTHIDVTAKLTRLYGTPSQGLTVKFRDSSSSSPGSHPGIFIATTRSNNEGMATAQYHLQDTASITGYIYIIGYIDTGNNNTVIGINRISLQ